MKFASVMLVLALSFLLIPGYKMMSATLGSTQVYLTQLAKLIQLSETLCGAPMTCQHRATAGNKCRCSCDKFCNYRHDCCLDVTDRDAMPDQSGNGTCVTPNDDPDKLVSVIETCVPDSTELYHAMCGIDYTFIGNILVTNKDTGKTYKNLVCAVCNGELEADLVPWTPVCNTKCRAVDINSLTGSPEVGNSTGGLNLVDWDTLRRGIGQGQSQFIRNRAIRSIGNRGSGNTVTMSTPRMNFWSDQSNSIDQEPQENGLSDMQNGDSSFETIMQQENFCILGFSIPQGSLGGFGEIESSSKDGGGFEELPISTTNGFGSDKNKGFASFATQSISNDGGFTQANSNGGGFGNIFTQPYGNTDGFTQTNGNGGGFGNLFTQPDVNTDGFTKTTNFGNPNSGQNDQNEFENGGNAGDLGFPVTVPNNIGSVEDMFTQPNSELGGGGFGIPDTVHSNFGGFTQQNNQFGGGGFGFPGTIPNDFGGFGEMNTQPNNQFGAGIQYEFETNFSNYDGTVQTFLQQFSLQDPRTCNLTFEPPSGIEIAPSTCNGQVLVSDCDDQLRETLEDFDLIELACREMNTPFILSLETGESVVYKNVFCFICSDTGSLTNSPSRSIDGTLRDETDALDVSKASNSRVDIILCFSSIWWTSLIAVGELCGHL